MTEQNYAPVRDSTTFTEPMANPATQTAKYERRKIEFSIRFRLRPSQAQDRCERPLLIRLTVNGETVSDYSSGVKVLPQRWNQKAQQVSGHNQLATVVNEQLAQVRVQHYDILRELKSRHKKGQGPRVTAKLIKAEFVNPGSTSPNIIEAYKTYLDYLDSLQTTEDGRANKTLDRAYKTLDHLLRFEDPTYKRGIPIKAILLSDLTTGWGKQFHVWLQKHPDTGKHRMIKDSANKHLSHVRDAVSHAVDCGFLTINPLDKLRPKRGKGKEVYFLEPDHLERLLGLNLPEQAGVVLWWARLMCFTGLDYVDAIRYARNRQSFHHRNSIGLKIVIGRSKPPMNSCEIPLIGQVYDFIDALFLDYPLGPAAPILADVNRHLKLIQVAIGFHKPLTSKICRKTAGAFFLREGYQMATVSKALGHSSIRTTEAHYVKVTSSATDYDMERVARQQLTGGIRLQPQVIELPFGQPNLLS